MSAKNCLLIAYPKDGTPFVVIPTDEPYFSKKDAQRRASEMKSELPHIEKIDVVSRAIEVNG